MNRFYLFLLPLFAFPLFAHSVAGQRPQGNLVMVGGALAASNYEVYEKFIDLAGGVDNAKIAIIGAASSKPVKYGRLFKNSLVNYGAYQGNISVLPIAYKDDPTTPHVDEAEWFANAENANWADSIRQYSGIWFVGGDQTRIYNTLLRNGEQTPLLQAIWEVYRNGGVIGGTSAGAAIMSHVMIGGGSSFGALRYGFTEQYSAMQQQEYGPVYEAHGLGFFPHGVIDQHFDRKARLARLIRVCYKHRNTYPLGLGIDENTALVYYGAQETVEAIGKGGITIVDVSQATYEDVQGLAKFKHVDISYISGRDKFHPETKKFTVNPNKAATVGHEYMQVKDPVSSGTCNSNGQLKDFITFSLVDNGAADQAISYCKSAGELGFKLIFSQTPRTEGYWAYLDGQVDSYTALHVRLDILPVRFNIKNL